MATLLSLSSFFNIQKLTIKYRIYLGNSNTSNEMNNIQKNAIGNMKLKNYGNEILKCNARSENSVDIYCIET